LQESLEQQQHSQPKEDFDEIPIRVVKLKFEDLVQQELEKE